MTTIISEKAHKADILIVDDTIANLQLLSNILTKVGYKVRPATNGKLALQAVKQKLPDIILLDIKMPEMDGYEVCKVLKTDPLTKDIPILFISALSDAADKVQAFTLGGVDYITKPFQFEEVKARVATHLQLKDYQNHLKDKIDEGLTEIRALNQEIIDTQREVLTTIGEICETRSRETGQHVKRVAEYSYLLAQLAGVKDANLIKQASPMHDIGKMAIPDSILNKPGKLNKDEWQIMKSHATLGQTMLINSHRPIFKMASIIAFEHHECWDGNGYPKGLQGNDIHIAGRITALADVFDALGSKRCYKDAWSQDETLSLMKEQRGLHFDPELIDIFFANLDAFLQIQNKYPDRL